MPTPAEHLEFAYPYLFDGSDARYTDPPVIIWALAAAVAQRPTCLPEETQNLAQAHFAAYVLESRRANLAVSGVVTTVNSGVVVEKQEGSTRIRYSDPTSSTSSLRSTRSSAPYDAWKLLWDRCAGTLGADGQVLVPSGALITSYGWPD